MFRCMRQCQGGSPTLEMVLFTPLALFFLFVVIDGGTCLLEKASLSDALRSGLYDDASCLKENGAFSLNTSGDVVLTNSLDRLLACIAEHISSNLKREKQQDSITDNTQITVRAVLANFDKHSGALTSYRILADEIKRGSFDIRTAVPDYPSTTAENFIADAFEPELKLSRSHRAVPEGAVINGPDSSLGRVNFQESVLFVYGEITALAGKLNPTYSKSVLGRFYALQEQELHFLRVQLS